MTPSALRLLRALAAGPLSPSALALSLGVSTRRERAIRASVPVGLVVETKGGFALTDEGRAAVAGAPEQLRNSDRNTGIPLRNTCSGTAEHPPEQGGRGVPPYKASPEEKKSCCSCSSESCQNGSETAWMLAQALLARDAENAALRAENARLRSGTPSGIAEHPPEHSAVPEQRNTSAPTVPLVPLPGETRPSGEVVHRDVKPENVPADTARLERAVEEQLRQDRESGTKIRNEGALRRTIRERLLREPGDVDRLTREAGERQEREKAKSRPRETLAEWNARQLAAARERDLGRFGVAGVGT